MKLKRPVWPLLMMLAPLQALALGGDPNLLVKPKSPKANEGYVLFSILYQKSALRPGETPCVKVELRPVVSEGAKQQRGQWLSTATGMHCNTAWKDTQTTAVEDDIARVTILTSLPAGEYKITGRSVQYAVAQLTATGDAPVVGFDRIHIAAGKLAYAGAFRLLQSSGRTMIAAASLWEKDSEVLMKLRPDLDAREPIMANWTDPPGR